MNRGRVRAPLVTMLLSVVFAAPGAHAWDTRTLDQVLPERLSLTVQHRTRFEYLDEQFRLGRPGDNEVVALRTLVHGRLRLSDGLRLGAELQDSRVAHDSDALLNTSLVNSVELLRAYAAFEHTLFGGRVSGQLGRMTLDVGTRRFVARNRFRNTINAFTGLDLSWKSAGGTSLRGFYTLPVRRLPTEVARLHNNEIRNDEESVDLQFWGLFASGALPVLGNAELFVFGLHERDDPQSRTRRRALYTPGFRVFRPPAPGRLDYQLESALQFGDSRATPAGRRLEHVAHFHHVELGYSLNAPWFLRIAVQYDYASGDDDPNDGKNNRFDTLFGARRFDFGPTSSYGPFARANLNTPGIRLQWRPTPTLSSLVAFRGFWLADKRDAWTTSRVRDTGGDSGSFVGSQLELRVRWKVLPGNATLEVGYAHLFGGGFIDDAPNSNDQGDSNYVYTQIAIGF